jgi:uncharacterized protein (TIGR02246 family)
MFSTRAIFCRAVLAALPAALAAATAVASAAEPCCLANFRFAGGCVVVPGESETCQGVLDYLNRFDTVGRSYCGSTTVRGGWTLTQCGDSLNARPQTLEPGPAQPARPAQRQIQTIRPVEPQAPLQAQDATLMRVSAPLKVRFDEGVDPGRQRAGDTVTGTLLADLVSGDTVIAPAGSKVQAQLVPASFWTEGAGGSLALQATGIEVDGHLVPVSASAAAPASGATAELSFTSAPPAATQVSSTMAATPGRWMELFNGRDAEGLAAMYAEDAVMLPPNEPAIFGRDAIRAGFRETFGSLDLKAEIEALEVVVDGDLAYVAGRYRMWTGDGILVDRGKYVEIWRAIDGQWLIHRDIHNSSLPPAGAASDAD